MISNSQRGIPVAVEPLARFLEQVRRELGFPPCSVAVRLVGDAAMARLNRTFRGKPGPTDVLSFPVKGRRPGRLQRKTSKPAEPGEGHVGDIAISPRVALRNAHRFSRSLPVELRILILHGMLHLAGYDHETDNGQMERVERRLRRRFGLIRS
jgi:probable rRNA maturation factor